MTKQAPLDIHNKERIGQSVAELDAHLQGWRVWPIQVTGFSVRAPRHEDDDFLITARGVDAEDVKVVAFHGALSLGEALRGFETRARNGTLKWKVDEWAKA